MITPNNMATVKINAIACQDNPDLKIVHLTCFDKFKDIAAIQGYATEVVARCPSPKKCEGEDHEVNGEPTGYSPESMVCRAAHHAKVLKLSTAGFIISIFKNLSNKKQFNGGDSNKITSKPKEYKDETDS
jgi:hypothetical protein